MHMGNPCCVAGLGSWVDDLGQLMQTAGQVYQQVSNQVPAIHLPSGPWGSGEPTWGGRTIPATTGGTWVTQPDGTDLWVPNQQTNLMPLLLVGGLAFLLLRR